MQMLSERLGKIKKSRRGKKDADGERDPKQAWFWTKKWQAGEREAAEDIRVGRVAKLSDASDLDKSYEDLFGEDN